MRRPVQPVERACVLENSAEPRQFEIVRTLHAHEIILRNARQRVARKGKGLRRAVYRDYAPPFRARNRRAARGQNVHDHAFDEIFHTVRGDGIARNGHHLAQNAAAVAEQHATEIERGRADQSVHFGVE